MPSGISTRSADRTPKRRKILPRRLVERYFGVGVVDDVGIASELREIVAAQRLRLEEVWFSRGTGHRVDAKRRAVLAPRRDDEHVVRQAAANDLGDLVEDVTDVERAGHRLQQPPQAVDAFAPQLVALDDRVVLEGETEQIDDAVHQLLMGGAERVLAARREPERAVHARALPDGAHDARACRLVHGVELRGGISDEMLRDLDVSGFAGDVEDERVRAIEAQHVQPLEWNRRAQCAGHTGNDVAKTRRFRDQTRNRREHVYGISLGHLERVSLEQRSRPTSIIPPICPLRRQCALRSSSPRWRP